MVFGEHHSKLRIVFEHPHDAGNEATRAHQIHQQLPSPVRLRAVVRAALGVDVRDDLMGGQSLAETGDEGCDVAAGIGDARQLQCCLWHPCGHHVPHFFLSLGRGDRHVQRERERNVSKVVGDILDQVGVVDVRVNGDVGNRTQGSARRVRQGDDRTAGFTVRRRKRRLGQQQDRLTAKIRDALAASRRLFRTRGGCNHGCFGVRTSVRRPGSAALLSSMAEKVDQRIHSAARHIGVGLQVEAGTEQRSRVASHAGPVLQVMLHRRHLQHRDILVLLEIPRLVEPS